MEGLLGLTYSNALASVYASKVLLQQSNLLVHLVGDEPGLTLGLVSGLEPTISALLVIWPTKDIGRVSLGTIETNTRPKVPLPLIDYT
jgi:hypothetical protein